MEVADELVWILNSFDSWLVLDPVVSSKDEILRNLRLAGLSIHQISLYNLFLYRFIAVYIIWECLNLSFIIII